MIKIRFSYLLLGIFICIIYSGTLFYPWHLDDLPNITHNYSIQLTELTPQNLWSVLFATPGNSNIPSRYVAFVSFAFNWYFGQSSTFGYHIVNIVIHFCTAIVLFHTIILLLQAPKLLKRYSQADAYFIALLSSLLWAAHPIQIQAVTYIVQRMTSLAALFFLWSLFWYLKCRFTVDSWGKFKYITASLTCYFLAVGSKENAVLLPITLVIVEYCFFFAPQYLFSKIIKICLMVVTTVLIVASIYYLYSHYLTKDFFTASGVRPYSLYERLLTQPRILILYLSLIFYPLSIRFSIDHSITTSTTLFQPWTTFPAIFFISSLFILGLFLLRKKPIWGFAISFFFINHIIESSIIPLEMVFEHRNYLPTLFLFIPFAIILHSGLQYYQTASRFVFVAIALFIPSFLFLLGWGTFLRNNAWSSQEILWTDAMTKAPNNARPFTYLGQIYGWNKPHTQENLTKAIDYYQQARGKYGPSKPYSNAILANIAGIYFNYAHYAEATNYYKLVIANDPNLHPFRFGLAQVLTIQKRFSEADEHLDYIINHSKDTKKINRAYNLKGVLFLWQNQPKNAINSFGFALRNSYDKSQFFYNIGVAFSRAGYYRKAKFYLKNALKNQPKSILIMLSVIENSIRNKDIISAKKQAENLYKVFDLSTINTSLQDTGNERFRSVPIDIDLIKPVVYEAGRNLINDYTSNLTKLHK